MFVNNLMLETEKLITVTPEDTVKKALELMEKYNFLSIPVSEGAKFYGAISKERIYTFYFEKDLDKQSLLSEFSVKDVMREDVPTIDPMNLIEEAANFLATENTPFVAVVNANGEFQGIITHHGVFKQFTEMFGLYRGQRISVIATDVPNQIAKLSKIMADNDAGIISFVIVDPKSLTEVREIIVRIKSKNFDDIIKKLKDEGFRVN